MPGVDLPKMAVTGQLRVGGGILSPEAGQRDGGVGLAGGQIPK